MASPHPMVGCQGIVHFESLELCESPAVLKVVSAGFVRSYRLYEEIRFISSKKRKSWNNFLLLNSVSLDEGSCCSCKRIISSVILN